MRLIPVCIFLIQGELKEALEKIQPNNAQGEYYLPDTLTIIKDKGLKVDAFALSDRRDIMGVNDQEQLKSAAEIIRRRNQANKWDGKIYSGHCG